MNYQSPNQTKSVWKTTLVIVAVLLIFAGLLWLSVNFGTTKKLSSQGRDDNVGSNHYPHQSNTKPQTPHNDKPSYPIESTTTTNANQPKREIPITNVSPKVEYDPQTGNEIKGTTYNSDGKTINYIGECDPQTGNIIKITLYNSDGTKVITEYNPQTGNEIKYTSYKSDGKTIKSISEYDPQTGNIIKGTSYNSDGKTINYIGECDPQTGNIIKSTLYNSDGTKVITEYNPQTGNEIKYTSYKSDGKTIEYIIEYDPKTGKEIKKAP
ncbi:DUF2963 domain-containing protein [Mulberry dwarf phytoplasma]|uniref:DUF2963 domain-containing protein n=1 Tax=Mulberry dwarf phytoplasma TaxID=186171 RepID=UPI001D10A6BB|nr:DUF2963 domain-containing protein [Mulberry dwarf phytoplasma]